MGVLLTVSVCTCLLGCVWGFLVEGGGMSRGVAVQVDRQLNKQVLHGPGVTKDCLIADNEGKKKV